ncbi:MAG: hypothetical protein ACLQLC_03035 [Candidatus Sulfotelmatobacter sp.]
MAVAEIPFAGPMRIHTYHGEADLLEMEIKEPFHEKVKPQAKVELYGGGERSHYHFKHAGPFRVEGIASYESGYTQVAGARSLKHEGRYSTLVTSALEGLNILDVLTADRVVAQISTAHPLDGAVPEVSFLGTRFENLRIAGHKVELDANLEILGPRPVKDQSYFDNQNVMDRMAQQYQKLSTDENLPDWASERYPRDQQVWRSAETDSRADIAKCSLVNRVHCSEKSFGHVVDVPHFGKFFLGELTVKRVPGRKPDEFDAYTFCLTMVRMELGCTVAGGGGAGTATSNGQGSGTIH